MPHVDIDPSSYKFATQSDTRTILPRPFKRLVNGTG
jgi:hypothetical protein